MAFHMVLLVVPRTLPLLPSDNHNLSQALLSSNADDRIKAINAEMKQMGAEEACEALLTIPYGKPWVPSHMILVTQRYADGSIKKYKARLVAGGIVKNLRHMSKLAVQPQD